MRLLDPAGDGFTIALSLRRTTSPLKASSFRERRRASTPPTVSGYRIGHNPIRLNSLFGLDFGSAGTRESRVDHNCIRENRYGPCPNRQRLRLAKHRTR